jgi:hypothetical protein
MAHSLRSTDRQHRIPSSISTGQGEQPKTGRRRFDRVAVGFWVGATVLGTLGCILGACLPYRQPVARVVSVLWWGIYLRVLGASLGALLGELTNRTQTPPAPEQNYSSKKGCRSASLAARKDF